MLSSVFPSVPPYDGRIPQSACCYFCGSTESLHRHHILAGPLRGLSDREGLWVYLCEYHHLPPFGIHAKLTRAGFSRTDDEHLRWHAQQAWETRHMIRCGCSEEDARKAWRNLGKAPIQSYDYVSDDDHGRWMH